jgi:hypothetical protein
MRGAKTMPNLNQQRVLVRNGARTLSPEEIAIVNGAQNQTFVFTHIINPDTTRD